MKLTLNTLLGRCLVVATALNLNGVVNMVFGVGQALSIIILVASLTLILRVGKAALSGLMISFIATIGMYITFGAFFTRTDESAQTLLDYGLTYGGTVLLVWGITGYFIYSGQKAKWLEELNFTRDVFVLSAASVWVSPFLYTLYVQAPISIHYRMSGFFGNPNEAAAVAAVGLALVINHPYRSLAINGTVALLCIGAILLTFSKSGVLICLIILALGALRWSKGFGRVILTVSVALAALIANNSSDLSRQIAEQNIVSLNLDQQRRVLQLGELLSGQITANSTTGRTVLLEGHLPIIFERQPFGGGLGSMHHIQGGIIENNVWQGIHNTFLMIIGEAGLIPGLMFAITFFLIGYQILTTKSLGWELSVFFIIIMVFMSNHNGLALRFVALAIAILMASLCLANRAKGSASISKSPARLGVKLNKRALSSRARY